MTPPHDLPVPTGDDRHRLEAATDRLEKDIDRFRIAIQRFLGGDLKAPPIELRQATRERLRLLRSMARGVAETFRLGTLEARFNSHCAHLERQLLASERGHDARFQRTPEPVPDPHRGIVIGERSAPAAVEALYQGLYLRGEDQRPVIDLDRFRAHLKRNVQIIRAKTGCQDVLFRIAEEDGKTKLKAKPLRAGAE